MQSAEHEVAAKLITRHSPLITNSVGAAEFDHFAAAALDLDAGDAIAVAMQRDLRFVRVVGSGRSRGRSRGRSTQRLKRGSSGSVAHHADAQFAAIASQGRGNG